MWWEQSLLAQLTPHMHMVHSSMKCSSWMIIHKDLLNCCSKPQVTVRCDSILICMHVVRYAYLCWVRGVIIGFLTSPLYCKYLYQSNPWLCRSTSCSMSLDGRVKWIHQRVRRRIEVTVTSLRLWTSGTQWSKCCRNHLQDLKSASRRVSTWGRSLSRMRLRDGSGMPHYLHYTHKPKTQILTNRNLNNIWKIS